jgi:hypothetical protein
LLGGCDVIYSNPRYDGGRFTLSPQTASAFSIAFVPIPSKLWRAETSHWLYYITSTTGVSLRAPGSRWVAESDFFACASNPDSSSETVKLRPAATVSNVCSINFRSKAWKAASLSAGRERSIILYGRAKNLFLNRSRSVGITEQVTDGNPESVSYSEKTADGWISSPLFNVRHVATL